MASEIVDFCGAEQEFLVEYLNITATSMKLYQKRVHIVHQCLLSPICRYHLRNCQTFARLSYCIPQMGDGKKPYKNPDFKSVATYKAFDSIIIRYHSLNIGLYQAEKGESGLQIGTLSVLYLTITYNLVAVGLKVSRLLHKRHFVLRGIKQNGPCM